MELTIEQIKEKQRKLHEDLKNILIEFEKDTKITFHGEIGYQRGIPSRVYVLLNFSNPFE